MGKISIFFTNLGKYNEGYLTGEWVKLPIDEDDLDNFDLLEGIDSDCDIGEYFAEECFLLHGIPDSVARYFDYESYGRDIRMELNCCITSYGLIIDNR